MEIVNKNTVKKQNKIASGIGKSGFGAHGYMSVREWEIGYGVNSFIVH